MKETVTDYKTVEETREITICDECGQALAEDENAVRVALNPYAEQIEEKLVRWFTTTDAAEEELRHMTGFEHIEPFRYTDHGGHGVEAAAETRREINRLTKAAAMLEWCPGCASSKLAGDLTEKIESDGVISDISISGSQANVTVTEEPLVRVTGASSAVFGAGVATAILLSVWTWLSPTRAYNILLIAGLVLGTVALYLIHQEDEDQ